MSWLGRVLVTMLVVTVLVGLLQVGIRIVLLMMRQPVQDVVSCCLLVLRTGCGYGRVRSWHGWLLPACRVVSLVFTVVSGLRRGLWALL